MVKNLHWPPGEKYGVSGGKGQLINIRKDQVLKVLLDVGAGHRGWRGGVPGQGWLLKSRMDTNTISGHVVFPAWLHVPSPRAPEHQAPKEKGKCTSVL